VAVETHERRRGAPRNEAARLAILRATASLFATRGYDHLTIEGIAAEAGVAKQTIYRWWPSRSALVAEALIEGLLLTGPFDLPDTGDIRADLVAWLEGLFVFLDDPRNNALICSLVAAAAENPEIGLRLNDALGATTLLAERLDAAVAADDLWRDTPVQEIGDAVLGVLVVRALQRTPADPGLPARLVRVLLRDPAGPR